MANESATKQDLDKIGIDVYPLELIKELRQQGWMVTCEDDNSWITVLMPGEVEPWHALKAQIKSYPNPSRYGLEHGRISKLAIYWGAQSLYSYDRGVDFDDLDEHPDGREFFESILGISN